MLKTVTCPDCGGYGFVTHNEDNGVWSERCKNCDGLGVISKFMTNGDVIRYCDNEELVKLYNNLKENKLLFDSVESISAWINKETDEHDMENIFNFIDEDEGI